MVFAPKYFEVQPYCKNKSDLNSLCRESVRRYDCQFLDYSKKSLCYSQNYFYNSQHLNKESAELFPLDLGKKIKLLLKQ